MKPERAYTILGLSPGGSTPEDILKAYRRRAMECHPDRAPSLAESDDYTRRFLEVRDAYESLKKAGFPVPPAEEVVKEPSQVRSYERRFGKREDEKEFDVPLREKLGYGPGPTVEQWFFWGILVPACAIGMYLSLRWLAAVVRGDAALP
ncbi:MAG: DnaJ domain-containing protein [Elusimicrobia bacterium]|nr:DnaJ domain-containing protein [Elusimicrobiota bacterium]